MSLLMVYSLRVRKTEKSYLCQTLVNTFLCIPFVVSYTYNVSVLVLHLNLREGTNSFVVGGYK